MLTPDNFIVITTTLKNNRISKLRMYNLLHNFFKYKIKIKFNEGIKEHNTRFYQLLLNRFMTFKQSNYDYGLICDDDFFPIDNFLIELNTTVKNLPEDWECLHLCPGFLWGRKYRDYSKKGKLNAEYDIRELKFDSSGRYFNNCDSKTYYRLRGWLGGPIAMLVNKKNINNIINKYKLYEKSDLNNDVILTKILNKNAFICRNPQLCYEKECGGSTFR